MNEQEQSERRELLERLRGRKDRRDAERRNEIKRALLSKGHPTRTHKRGHAPRVGKH